MTQDLFWANFATEASLLEADCCVSPFLSQNVLTYELEIKQFSIRYNFLLAKSYIDSSVQRLTSPRVDNIVAIATLSSACVPIAKANTWPSLCAIEKAMGEY